MKLRLSQKILFERSMVRLQRIPNQIINESCIIINNIQVIFHRDFFYETFFFK